MLPALCVVPNGILAGDPLLLYRFFIGRCLTRSREQAASRRFGLEGIFLFTSLIAALLMLANSALRQSSLGSGNSKLIVWQTFLGLGIVCFIASSVAVLPVTICYFTARA